MPKEHIADIGDTVTVPVARVKTYITLAVCLVAASSLITFIATGQEQINKTRQDLSSACARAERKDAEHDASLQLIQQQLGQLNSNVERLLSIQLEQNRRVR